MTTESETAIHFGPFPEADRHPVYCQYPSQSNPQDAYIALDCRDGAVWADYNGEIGNAVPMDVWHGHIRRYAISPNASAEAINAAVEGHRAEFEAVMAGYEDYWNGSNRGARFSETAQEADYRLQKAFNDNDLTPEPCSDECGVCWPDD